MTVRVVKKRYNPDQIKEGIVRVGWFGGLRYDDGTPVAKVARAQEFGVPASMNNGHKIPARPFMRPVMHGQQDQLTERLKSLYRQALNNNTSTKTALEIFGIEVVSRIQTQIISTNYPPNAPMTIKIKGFNKPLYHTGFMLNSVSYEVEEIIK